MTISVTLPALGESVTEGTVTRWLKQVGETVEADEPLLEVSTDKVDTEIPSPASGVLLKIVVPEDENAEVGAELAVIGSPAAPAPVAEAPAASAVAEPRSAPPAPPTPPAAPAAPAPAVPVAPAAPAPAAPAQPAVPVAPAAPAAPVAAPAVTSPEAAALRGRTVPMSRIRKVIGENLKKALHEQAQLTSVVEADVTALMRLRARSKDAFAAREGISLSPLPFFISAAVQALKAHPAVNARINEAEGTITYFDTENIGIAVDTEKGLMTPVIKAAGDLSVPGVARAVVELARKARGGGLTPDDVTGATFSISNTGSRGALFDTVVVPPGHAAILGVGAVVTRPAVVDTPDGPVIGVRDLVHLSLSYDHRLVDGADAARYLTAVKAILEAAAFAGDLFQENPAQA
ncbi:2-oxo acid dehydrogenase subunit E2 [Streptomyces sp. AS58]|uniref:2-oxo acid dehydrogenase subunit E2 n=1 Tax=Streptomyces sp. AS58 TaxID=1519489 RepID=UPI0006AFE44A|nr:2-oxo acid dehydrogenase subunit E2 [Streptomyces sp. AS58]